LTHLLARKMYHMTEVATATHLQCWLRDLECKGRCLTTEVSSFFLACLHSAISMAHGLIKSSPIV
jgi:hypothetical protein